MRYVALTTLALGGTALAVVLIGCGPGEPERTAPPPPPEQTGRPATGAELGEPQMAGPFEVTLTADAPAAGDTRFYVEVTDAGEPVEDAVVEIDTSMPGHGMTGPSALLAPTGGGFYEGAIELSMGGEWEATVRVTHEADSVSATYRFDADG